jgi:hypothetical protein
MSNRYSNFLRACRGFEARQRSDLRHYRLRSVWPEEGHEGRDFTVLSYGPDGLAKEVSSG